MLCPSMAKRAFDAWKSHICPFPLARNVASFGQWRKPRTKLSLNVPLTGKCGNQITLDRLPSIQTMRVIVRARCLERAKGVRVKRSRHGPTVSRARVGNSLSTWIHYGRQFRHCATELVRGWLVDGIRSAHKVAWLAHASVRRPRGAPWVRPSSKHTCLEASVYAEPKPVPIPNAATAARLVAFPVRFFRSASPASTCVAAPIGLGPSHVVSLSPPSSSRSTASPRTKQQQRRRGARQSSVHAPAEQQIDGSVPLLVQRERFRSLRRWRHRPVHRTAR